MSRTSNRASTVVAIFGIVLLVLFLVILWTSVRITSFRGEEGTDQRPELWVTPSSEPESLNGSDDQRTTARGVTLSRYSFNNEGKLALVSVVLAVFWSH